MSADDFSALEERIVRAVEMVKRERLARAEAEKRADAADARLREAAPLTENLQKEVSALRGEREQVRQRVERLLSQLDALEL
jgi:FtsZ-binding cell division protein ZapB